MQLQQDADNSTSGQNLKGNFSASQSGNIIHEVAQHSDFSGLCADHGLHLNVNLFSLSHYRSCQHGKTDAGRSDC